MLSSLARLLGLSRSTANRPPAGPAWSAPPQPADPEIDNGVGHLTKQLLPAWPLHNDEPVPRWPEHGAALVAATPDALLETQADLLQRLRDTTSLSGTDFDRLILPAFRRYAAWVHLLPASENHHHYGPGGLLRHGFEVALHAARMAEGKHVGLDLPPSARAKYALRWRAGAMLGGLLHDIGKPLVDAGATDPDHRITWPASGDLYSWLVANNLSHYRIYWRKGARHERHKPVGTAVMREILGPELTTWLADEPTQDLMNLLLMTVAGSTTANNTMSLVVSKADSLSVEADLKRLAKRTQATAAGGLNSAAGLVMASLRKLVESNRLTVNRTGGQLWVVNDGCFGVFPALLDTVVAQMQRESAPGLPANRGEIAELLAETGFIEPCVADTEDGRQRSLTWDLRVQLRRCDEVAMSAPIKTIKFTDPRMVFGIVPLPPPTEGVAKSPFLSIQEAEQIAESVTVETAPQSAQSAIEAGPASPVAHDAEGAEPMAAAQTSPEDAANDQPAEAAPADGQTPTPYSGPAQAGAATSPSDDQAPDDADSEVHIADRRNGRDIAVQRRREVLAGEKPKANLRELIQKVQRSSLCGPACAEVLRNIYRGRLQFGTDYFGNTDGLVVAYPKGLEGLGIPPEDLLAGAVESRWVVVDDGAVRKVTERTFPDGKRRECVIFGGDIGATWEAMAAEYPAVLDATRVVQSEKVAAPRPAAPEPPAAAPPPRQPKPVPAPTRQAPKGPAQGSTAPTADSGPARSTADTTPATPVASRPVQVAKGGKLERPALGAQPPVPLTGPEALRSPSDSAPQRRAPPQPARSAAAETPDAGPGPIRCNLISELTPRLVADINATFVLAAEHMVLRSSRYDLNSPEDLKAVMRVMVQDAGVRVAPLLTALTTTDNPAVLMELPPMMTIKEIPAVRMNPEYQRPAWLVERLAKARQQVRSQA